MTRSEKQSCMSLINHPSQLIHPEDFTHWLGESFWLSIGIGNTTTTSRNKCEDWLSKQPRLPGCTPGWRGRCQCVDLIVTFCKPSAQELIQRSINKIGIVMFTSN
jgi:hypothetical protein